VVNTGALLTVISGDVLEELGISPIEERRFRGFGGVVTRDIGAAIVRYAGSAAGISVIFGEEGDAPVLGVTALEALSYLVNPTTHEIRRVESLQL